MELWINYLDQILLYATLALSLNLLLGYAGQVSVAHAAFGAIGGYAMAYMTQTPRLELPRSARCSAWCSPFIIGTLVALPGAEAVRRVPHPADAGGLVGDHRVCSSPSRAWAARTASSTCRRPTCSAGQLQQPAGLAAAVVPGDGASSTVICHRIGESPIGRVLKGIREDPIATQALGKNVFAYKVTRLRPSPRRWPASPAPCSPAGCRCRRPGVFGFTFSLTVFAIVIFGGMANLTGTDARRRRRRPARSGPPSGPSSIEAAKASLVQLIVYGLALVVLMRLRPQGALPEGFSVWRWIRASASPRHASRWPTTGCRSIRSTARRRARRQRAPPTARRTARAGLARCAGRPADVRREQALRRHRRRRRPGHRAAQGHDHRARRPERGRQDHGVQPPHRGHPARLRDRCCSTARSWSASTRTRSPARAWSARSRTCACSAGSPACRT